MQRRAADTATNELTAVRWPSVSLEQQTHRTLPLSNYRKQHRKGCAGGTQLWKTADKDAIRRMCGAARRSAGISDAAKHRAQKQ